MTPGFLPLKRLAPRASRTFQQPGVSPRAYKLYLLCPRLAMRIQLHHCWDYIFLAFFYNPCGNFSDTSGLKFQGPKGSIGHVFTVCIRTENQNQTSFYPFVLHEISVLIELILGHLRYCLTDVPPQPNSPPDNVFNLDRGYRGKAGLPPPYLFMPLKFQKKGGVCPPVSTSLNK